jgi:hypothetical protein
MGRLYFPPSTKALLSTKPGSIKRLKLIAAEMKKTLAELRAMKTQPHLKERDRVRLCGRAWDLYDDLNEYQKKPKQAAFLSKVPLSLVRMYHALPKATFGTYRKVYSK